MDRREPWQLAREQLIRDHQRLVSQQAHRNGMVAITREQAAARAQREAALRERVAALEAKVEHDAPVLAAAEGIGRYLRRNAAGQAYLTSLGAGGVKAALHVLLEALDSRRAAMEEENERSTLL